MVKNICEVNDLKLFKSSKQKYTCDPQCRNYFPERIVDHNNIIKEHLDYAKRTINNKVYILGGGSGAGKSDFIIDFLIGLEEIDEDFLIIDADQVKYEIYDFKYWENIMSDDKASKEIDCSNPSDFVHDESSDIADKIIERGTSRNISFIYDGTFKNEEKYEKILTVLNRLGYEVEIIILDVSVAVALDRVEIRGLETGRDVPRKIVKSSNYKVAETFFNLKRKGLIKNCSIYDNSINGVKPKLVAQFVDGREDLILDEILFNEFEMKTELAKLLDRP